MQHWLFCLEFRCSDPCQGFSLSHSSGWSVEGKQRALHDVGGLPASSGFVGMGSAWRSLYQEKVCYAEWVAVSNQFFTTLIPAPHREDKPTPFWGRRVEPEVVARCEKFRDRRRSGLPDSSAAGSNNSARFQSGSVRNCYPVRAARTRRRGDHELWT